MSLSELAELTVPRPTLEDAYLVLMRGPAPKPARSETGALAGGLV